MATSKESFVPERLGHVDPEMYERSLRLVIYGVLALFTVASVLGLVLIKLSQDSNATQRPRLGRRRQLTEENDVTPVPALVRRYSHHGCEGSLYFRCVNDSTSEQYGIGEWFFIRSSDPPGECRQWNPDGVCLNNSRSHFRTQRACVDACEERRDKRCLGGVTPSMADDCSSEAPPAHFWYFDRLLRLCVPWKNVCLYTAFRSLGHCKMACILHHAH